jgi:hypothetical protein
MKKTRISLVFFLMVGSAFGQKRSKQFIFNAGVQKAGIYENEY